MSPTDWIERMFTEQGERTADTREAGGLGIVASPNPVGHAAAWWMTRARKLEAVIFAHLDAGRREAAAAEARPALTSQRLAEAMVTMFAEAILDTLRHPVDRRAAFRGERLAPPNTAPG